MDVARSFNYIAEDEKWLEKLATGTVLLIVSIILSSVLIGVLGTFIAIGYAIRLLQNVRDGKSKPLPEWNDWGQDLVRGFKLSVVGVIWSLPALLFGIPVAIGGALTDGGGSGEFVGVAILMCGMCLIFLYAIAVALMSPGFTIAFACNERIMDGLQVSAIWRWTQENLGQVILVVLVYIGVSIAVAILAPIVGLLLCIVGLLVTIPLGTLLLYLVEFHMFGQLAREFPMCDAIGREEEIIFEEIVNDIEDEAPLFEESMDDIEDISDIAEDSASNDQ